MVGSNTEEPIVSVKERKKKGFWAGLFLAILVLIVILVVVIVNIANRRSDDDPLVIIEESNKGLDLAYDVINKYYNDGDYTSEDAINEFKTLISNECRSDTCKITVAIVYADFVYERYHSISMVLDILGKYQSKIDSMDYDLKLSYYGKLKSIYKSEGDDEQVRYYSDKISDIMNGDLEEGDE